MLDFLLGLAFVSSMVTSAVIIGNYYSLGEIASGVGWLTAGGLVAALALVIWAMRDERRATRREHNLPC